MQLDNFISKLTSIIFPRIHDGKRWMPVNLDDEYLKRQDLDMRDPIQQQELVSSLTCNGSVRRFGGTNENRNHMLNGVIDGNTGYVHKGISFYNLQAGEAVASAVNGQISFTFIDKEKCGLGGVVSIKTVNNVYYIYTHLDSLEFKHNDTVTEGDIIGKVANRYNNGGWFEHVNLIIKRTNPIDEHDRITRDEVLEYAMI